MLRNTLFVLMIAAGFTAAASAQRLPTASKSLDIQAGAEGIYGHSDYGTKLKGYGIYGTIDFRPHLGVELEYHQGNGDDQIYERTYLAGVRYVWHHNRINPYVKVLGGRGVFNFPPYIPGGTSAANLAYNMFSPGGGVDYRIKSYLNIRGDYEYQFWLSGPGIIHGLTPMVASVGVAYHFK